MPPPFTRLASCCNLVKRSWNLGRVSSLVYTTCSDVSDSSSDTNVLCRALEKLGKFKVINATLLEQSKRERSSALLFIRQLKESGFKHDLETYMAVVRLLCHWDWDCYGELIRGYCLKGDTDKALDLCKEMESGGIKTDGKFVRQMMEHLWRIGKLDEALCLFKHFTQQSRVFIDEVSFCIAIYAACNVGKMDDAMGLIDEMKSRNIMPIDRQAQAGTNQFMYTI
ncbi:hypothetical protein Lser_V15G02039 [Lactuca serriola]